MIVLAHKLNEIQTKRAGVIPYIIIKKELYFLLGVDKESHDLTDFGGGVKKGETTLMGAIREFKEESRNIFKFHYNINHICNHVAITDGKEMSIIFLCVNKKWLNKARYNFHNHYNPQLDAQFDELEDVRWLTQNEFYNIIFNPNNDQLWKRVQRFFIKTFDEWDKKKELFRLLKLGTY